MKHKILNEPMDFPKGYKYLFDEMEVGDTASIVCRKGERDRKFHACRTRCAQVSKNGKKFRAYADDHSVYYKRES